MAAGAAAHCVSTASARQSRTATSSSASCRACCGLSGVGAAAPASWCCGSPAAPAAADADPASLALRRCALLASWPWLADRLAVPLAVPPRMRLMSEAKEGACDSAPAGCTPASTLAPSRNVSNASASASQLAAVSSPAAAAAASAGRPAGTAALKACALQRHRFS